VSGGTIDSLRQQLVEVSKDPQARSLVGRSDALVDDAPAPQQQRRHSGGRRMVDRDKVTGVWQSPFLMGAFNRQIVQRSNALAGGAYGAGFRYREVVDGGHGPRGAARAALVAGGSAALAAGMWFAPTRSLLDKVLPEPGAGPSERTLQRGRFRVEVVANTTSGARYRTAVGADKDPGYYGTAVMLGESGLALVLDRLPEAAGVLTPMVALGEALAVRLRRQDFVVETVRL
jgi:short subunit dehydrogenase-like uncharacterized protein